LKNALGKQLIVQESPYIAGLTVAINTEKKPFDDPRVRRALSLAVDRWEASRELSRITFVKEVGGLLRPGSEFAATEAELTRLAGFGKDIEASRREARRLLKEAGVPEGVSFTFKNRDIKSPYEPLGLFLIDQWRKVGLNVRHVIQETGPYVADLRAGNYETGMDFASHSMDEPDLLLFKFISASRSPANYARYNDPKLDELYQKQSRTTDPAERRRAHPRVRADRGGRESVSVSRSLESAHHRALGQDEGLEDHPQSVREPGFARCMAGGMTLGTEDVCLQPRA
jgi:peptide/nickel transport system substrate-binding protein